MISQCPYCDALLGPAEDSRGCLTCTGVELATNLDRVTAALEKAGTPVAHWDVHRLMEHDGSHVHPGSVQVWLSSEPRACWAGPGLYGLYRHGLLPGLRDLGALAAVFLLATELALSHDEIYFVLRHAGYRFQITSLNAALARAAGQGLVCWYGTWRASSFDAASLLGLNSAEDAAAVVARAQSQAAAALLERERRLS